MKDIFRLAFSLLFSPRETWQRLLYSKVTKRFIFSYVFTLASIGPVLSFFSMYILENISLQKTLVYCVVTFVLDILSVYIYGVLIKSFDRGINYETALKISAFGSTGIWLSDIVDIYQYLRPLSIFGFFYSMYLMYIVFREILKKDFRYIIFMLAVFSVLYGLNSLIAESIVQNPIIKKVVV
ncbi:MAG: hypothetical protein GXO22_01075 [Aquificae bacterium]|nr:hypothetical protein [Aquificota bacterium]